MDFFQQYAGCIEYVDDNYVYSVGACPNPGVYCPSVEEFKVQYLSEGFYTVNTFQRVRCIHSLDLSYCSPQRMCERGNFCNFGVKQKCPYGFICPHEGMDAPIPCDAIEDGTRTCFEEGLVSCHSPAIADTLDSRPSLPNVHRIPYALRHIYRRSHHHQASIPNYRAH